MLSRHTNNVKNEEGVGGKNPPSLRDVIAAQALPLKGTQQGLQSAVIPLFFKNNDNNKTL